MTALPIDGHLETLATHLSERGRCVLAAEPGAGKTTRVPLYLRHQHWVRGGKILLLAPRRIAARSAAERMAETIGETAGGQVGYRVRFDTKATTDTVIEVVTEGVFLRMIAADPSLEGIAAVIFDEFHERSLNADLALALTLDTAEALRSDLRILVMSATLETEPVAALLGQAPVISSTGRQYPVSTHYSPRDVRQRLEPQVVDVVRKAIMAEDGHALVFLPGRAEIERTARLFEDDPDLQNTFDIETLHAGLDQREQARLLQPAPKGRRRIILSTSIAETSLTLPDVRLVVDCGLSRRPRFEPHTGLTRLETVKVSLASADQRRGRAGRLSPGTCFRMWSEGQNGALLKRDRPEILEADLAGLVLTLAQNGIHDCTLLNWIDPPPQAAWDQAVDLLTLLQALGDDGRLTAHGRALADFPLHPRLSHMILCSNTMGLLQQACDIAALLSEPGLGGADIDLVERLRTFQAASDRRSKAARSEAKRWQALASDAKTTQDRTPSWHPLSTWATEIGVLLALAYPDRVAQQRGEQGRYLLRNGRGAELDLATSLSRAPCLAIAEVTGQAAASRVRLAAALDEADLRTLFEDQLEHRRSIRLSREGQKVIAEENLHCGALKLETKRVQATADEIIEANLNYVRKEGLAVLPWSADVKALLNRLRFAASKQSDHWPDVSEGALMDTLEVWLRPYLAGLDRLADLSPESFRGALLSLKPGLTPGELDRHLPNRIEAPSGRALHIDYAAEAGPSVSAKVQEFYGLTQHPTLLNGTVPLVVELLSPAHRPIQVTTDIAQFWKGSWADVRRDMRGRYPKHNWPEHPENTAASIRSTKPAAAEKPGKFDR